MSVCTNSDSWENSTHCSFKKSGNLLCRKHYGDLYEKDRKENECMIQGIMRFNRNTGVIVVERERSEDD